MFCGLLFLFNLKKGIMKKGVLKKVLGGMIGITLIATLSLFLPKTVVAESSAP